MPRCDAALKGALEQMSDCLHALEHGGTNLVSELYAVASTVSPPPAAVLVLEAVMILLSPSDVHKGPRARGGVSSWDAGRSFLLLPVADLVALLRMVNIATIPAANLNALREYAAHAEWPVAGSRIAGTFALAHLVDFVRAAVSYGDTLASEGGRPVAVLVGGRGSLLEAVIVVGDETLESDSGDWSPPAPVQARRDRPPQSVLSAPTEIAVVGAPPGGSHSAVDDGAVNFAGCGGESALRDAVVEVLVATFMGMSVFTSKSVVDGRDVTVNMYRDCGRVYIQVDAFRESTPVMTRFVWTRDDVEHVSELLVPSPLQRATAPPRPLTVREAYARLTELLHLDEDPSSGGRRELRIRRRRICLVQFARKVWCCALFLRQLAAN